MHPNIVRVYDFGEFEGNKYFTMQWIEGQTLANALEKAGAFDDEATVNIGRKVASALDAAHRRKILHRDLKPQNILLDKDREPYVADFGLARLVGDAGLSQVGVFLGTPHYASPEQANLLPLDERSDLYSLGVILFEMATGDRPFSGRDPADVLESHRKLPAPDPRQLRPSLPEPLSALILQCLEKDGSA